MHAQLARDVNVVQELITPLSCVCEYCCVGSGETARMRSFANRVCDQYQQFHALDN